jgi:lysozyme
MPRKIDTKGVRKLKQLETYVGYPYDDADASWPKKEVKDASKVKGTLTWGYGTTKNVVIGKRITQIQAEDILLEELAEYEAAVENLVKVRLTNNQFTALVLFTYNVGIGAFRKSTLLKRLNKGEYGAVPYEMLRWKKTRIDGKLVDSEGLENRRAAEIGIWGAGGEVASSHTEVEPLKKPIVTRESVSTAAMAVGASGLAGSTVFDGAGPIQYALAVVIVVAFLAAAYWFLRKRV